MRSFSFLAHPLVSFIPFLSFLSHFSLNLHTTPLRFRLFIHAMATTANTPPFSAVSRTSSLIFLALAFASYVRRMITRSIRPSRRTLEVGSGIGRGRSCLEGVRLSVSPHLLRSFHLFICRSVDPSSCHPPLLLMFVFFSSMLTVLILGSCINAMMYVSEILLLVVMVLTEIISFHEGAPSDYDEWAKIIGEEGWAYKNLKKCVVFSLSFRSSSFSPATSPLSLLHATSTPSFFLCLSPLYFSVFHLLAR